MASSVYRKSIQCLIITFWSEKPGLYSIRSFPTRKAMGGCFSYWYPIEGGAKLEESINHLSCTEIALWLRKNRVRLSKPFNLCQHILLLSQKWEEHSFIWLWRRRALCLYIFQRIQDLEKKTTGIERSESVNARESKKTEAEWNVNQSYGLID